MSRSDIWLSDLLYSIERLSIRDPATVRLVLQMLKLEQIDSRAPLSVATGPMVSPPVPLRGSSREDEDISPAAPPETGPEDSGGVFEIRRATLRPVEDPAPQPQLPQWYAEVPSLPRRANPPAAASMSRPLFPVRQSRALLSAALSTWDIDGSPDIPRTIEILARGEPVRNLPQRTAPTLRRGCQLLIDSSVSMAPFRLDIEHLLTQIHAVVARDRVEVRDFEGCPSRSVRSLMSHGLSTWKPPARGTPIFLLTDLGIGGPPLSEERASVGEWLEFANAAAVSGCPVVALVPYGPNRWPRALCGRINVIHWDHRTTAARVRKQTLAGGHSP